MTSGYSNRVNWSTPASPPVLKAGETHVWAFDLDVSAPRLEALEQLLSVDEMVRADRFHASRDRMRFIAARGQLRSILGRYVSRAPEMLQFAYSSFGKPSFAPLMGFEGLRFNASGSEALAMLAVQLEDEVGVDVEQIRIIPDALAVAQRMLTTREHDELTALSEELRLTRFFEYWARKESLVKSLGRGLWQPFDTFSLHESSGDEAQRVTMQLDGVNETHWVRPLPTPREGFVAALAARAPIGPVKCWMYDAG